MFSNFNYELKKILKNAKEEMYELGHSYIGTEHFLLSVLKSNNELKDILNNYNITYDSFKERIIVNIGKGNDKEKLFILTPLFKKILEDSILISNELRNDEIDPFMVFKSILEEGEGVAYRIICEMNVDIDKLYDSLFNYSIVKTNSINEYGVDLTEKAKKGLTEIAVNREKELENIIEILLRKNKRNPILIGPAGVGKTAIVEELANRIINSNVPDKLMNKKIISISMASLVAGTKYRGEFEEKILKILNNLENNNNLILFIDEIHTLVGAGGAEGAIDASNILKPVLSRGNITVIGATTTEEYRKYIEDDKALSRRFQKVIINEPNKKDLFDILKKIKPSYEKYHNVKIDNKVLKYIINISKKYIKNKNEPDRSIDLLDEALSMVSSRLNEKNNSIKLRNDLLKYKKKKNEMIENNNYIEALIYRKKERKIESIINNNCLIIPNNKHVTKEDINTLISKKYNIFLGNNNYLESNIGDKIEYLNRLFKNYVSEIDQICENIKKVFNCDISNNKPNSIFICGDNNLMKKRIINKINELFFHNKITIDLKNYYNDESINMIMGALPGYVGYNNKTNVFESLKEQPFSLIEITNFEYACLKVKNIIKDILHNGFFIDSNGYNIDFQNSLILINSNNIENNTIGFENKINNRKNELSKLVNKTIFINKNKITML